MKFKAKKKYISKYKWWILLFIVVFLVLIPLVINSLFKLTSPWSIFVAEWDAGDALAFYGVILASVATVIGVYISIDYAQKNYRIDERNRSKPYFALTHYKSYSKSDVLLGYDPVASNDNAAGNSNEIYEEYKLEKVFIIIEKEGIKFQDKLTDKQQKCLKNGGFEWVKHGNGVSSLQSSHFISMPFEAENVGNGAATNTLIALYKKDEECKGVSLYTIKKESSFYFHIFCEDAAIVKGSSYVIEIKYGDILGNNYSQKYSLQFGFDEKMNRFFTTVELTGKQEIADMNTEEESQ